MKFQIIMIFMVVLMTMEAEARRGSTNRYGRGGKSSYKKGYSGYKS